MVRAARTRAGTLAAGLSPTSAPLSRKDTEHMAIKDLLKSLVNESIEEMVNENSENDNTNTEDNTTEGGTDTEQKETETTTETGTKESSTLNFSDEDFKKELKSLIKKEVRDVACDMLNRTPSKSQPNNGVDVDAVFAGLLGFDTEKKGK